MRTPSNESLSPKGNGTAAARTAWRASRLRFVIEALETRCLLSTTFADIAYTDPFPEPTVAGEYVQPSSSVAVDEPGLRTSTSTDLVLPLPSSLMNGVPGISIEFSLKLTGPSNGNLSGTIISGPGFHVRSNWQFGTNGGIETGLVIASAGGKFMTVRTDPIPVRAGTALANEGVFRLDGKWHHYTITTDAKLISIYADGELVSSTWLGTMGTQIGPMSDGTNIRTVNNITLGKLTGGNGAIGEFKDVRVSTAELTAAQVMLNYEKMNKATVLFAAPTGTAGAAGTREQPLSLAAAIAQATANKRIVLLPGTYNGADFQLTSGGSDALSPLLITGDNGSGQAIIATTGSASALLSGVGFVRLQHLTFRGDTGPALRITNATGKVVLDGVRVTSNADGLAATGSKEVLVQNSVFSVPGTAMSFDSDGAVLRNNTIVGGSVGVNFNAANVYSMMNNLFSGATTGFVTNPTVFRVTGSSLDYWTMAADGNDFSPAAGGYIARVHGTNYSPSAFDSYRQYWFFNQTAHSNATLQDQYRHYYQGYMNELRSMSVAATFANSGSGDFRLASVVGNPINAGVSRLFAREKNTIDAVGISRAPTTDATGAARVQGTEVDVGAYEQAGPSQATFTLAAAAKTSAGIYDSTGKLVKTMWSNRQTAAGTVVVDWNGLDDLNQPLPAGTYTAKLLANNTTYVFEGMVGNNSNPANGQRVLGDFYTPRSVTVVPNSTTAYFTPGYNEARRPLRKFSTTDPTGADKIGEVQGWGDNYPRFIVADAAKVYFVRDLGGNLGRFDIATGVKDTAGGGFSGTPGGIAVQISGNLLFVANKTDNKVYVYDKNTFALQNSFAVANVGAIAAMPSGDLWAVSGTKIVRYTNLTTATPTVVREITGFANPLGIAVSQDGGLVAVADGGTSQQVKAYNPATGASVWTLGQAGGYANGPDISTTRYLLNGVIAFGKDGDVWVQDDASFRLLHFDANRTFLNDLAYIPHLYKTTVDKNNATRVFASYTEYQVNYGQPFVEGQGWTPVKYWGHGLPTLYYDHSGNAGGDAGFTEIMTLSNGRTYGITRQNDPADGQFKTRVLELTATGTRITSAIVDWRYILDENGAQNWTEPDTTAGLARFKQITITGFNASGDPIYSAPTQIATAPLVANWAGSDPVSENFVRTSSNLLVSLNGDNEGGFHLGAVSPGGTQWTWKANRSTGPFTGDGGTFDTFVQRGGNRLMTDGRNLVYGFHGEFWQGNGQATQFLHYYDNGLAIGQFGTPLNFWSGNDGYTQNGISGAAGNAYSPALVRGTDGNLYLYHNDESGRSVMRWRVDNAASINEMSATLSTGGVTAPAAPSGLSATAASSSQINLSWTDNSNNETGFKIERATDSGFTQNLTLVTTTAANATSYNNTGLTASTTYYYRVRATNSAGDSGNSNTASATTSGQTVTSYEAESGTLAGGAIVVSDGNASGGSKVSMGNSAGNSITFNNVDGGSGGTVTLTIRYSAVGASPIKSLKVNGVVVGSLTFPATGGWSTFGTITTTITLAAGTSNTIELLYNGSNTNGLQVDKIDVSVASATVPAAPSGLSATAASSSQINLSWTDNSNNETGFKIERATDSGFTQNLVLVTTTAANATSYNDTGLTASTIYYYRVRATNSSGDSANSNIASATTPGQTINSYEAESATLGGNAAVYADSNASGGSKVSMGNNVNDSVTFNNLSGGGGGATTLTIRFSEGGTAATKRLYVNGTLVGSITFTPTGGWNTFSTVITSITLAAGTANTIQIANGIDTYGVHLDKIDVQVNAVSPPAAPSGLSATAVSSSQINLSWTDNSNNETGFKIERATDSGFTQNLTLVTTTAANVTSYSNTGLAASTTYYYRVRATNSAGDSGYSNTASATTSGQTVTSYEAESGTLAGGAIVVSDGNASGGSKVSMGNSAGNSITFNNVDGGSGGTVTLTIRYSAVGASPIKSLKVNGVVVGSLTFPATGGWSTFGTITTTITLAAGTSNTIELLYNGSNTNGLQVDKIEISL